MSTSATYRSFAIVNPPRVTEVVAPAVEPWLSTDAEVTSFLRLDTTTDTALVTLCLLAARRHFERTTGLALVNQTLKVSYDLLPPGSTQYGLGLGFGIGASPLTTYAMLPTNGRELVMPRAPMTAISSFKYLDATGVLQTFDPANYTAGNIGVNHAYGVIWLNDSGSWPDFGAFPNALQITFTAGFGAAATSIPAEIRLAILWLATHWYENHLPVGTGDTLTELPFHLKNMIDHYRVAHVA